MESPIKGNFIDFNILFSCEACWLAEMNRPKMGCGAGSCRKVRPMATNEICPLLSCFFVVWKLVYRKSVCIASVLTASIFWCTSYAIFPSSFNCGSDRATSIPPSCIVTTYDTPYAEWLGFCVCKPRDVTETRALSQSKT